VPIPIPGPGCGEVAFSCCCCTAAVVAEPDSDCELDADVSGLRLIPVSASCSGCGGDVSRPLPTSFSVSVTDLPSCVLVTAICCCLENEKQHRIKNISSTVARTLSISICGGVLLHHLLTSKRTRYSSQADCYLGDVSKLADLDRVYETVQPAVLCSPTLSWLNPN
jgi:hypothetical protein